VEADRWHRIEQLFHETLAHHESTRGPFLDAECAGDPDLRREVDRLLSADRVAAGRLGAAVGGAVRSMYDPIAPGTRIGPYEILGPLGEGGMGRVYHARRIDGVFHKDIAIKVVKRGLDSDAILRRFQRERRILARLEHPAIARVLDGGSTDEGLPYLVMEYVDGRSLPQYADEQRLDLRARLRLFVQVCEAVHYAHAQQIVHRDLKPGNILVDASGRPRLLDFGIAALVGSDDPGLTATQGATGIMTPRYASPEQVKGEAVTPASDIYSLGILLYELLTGSSAHRLASDSPAAIVKAVCEDAVQAPSAAARAAMIDGRATPVPPASLDVAVDAVVLRAVAKDPRDRYASVQDFTADLERFLASQPISTSAPSALTLLATRRRRWALVAVALLAVAAIVAGGRYWSTRAARAARNPANGKMMLAVLPLENLTGNDERSLFVDGLHEEIISRLGRLQPTRLGVIARTSVLQYKGASKPIAQIGRELGANYILEGSVREAGATIRVTAQLIQVSDQTHLWTETYDRQLRDLFTVQSDIGARVADSLAVGVIPDTVASLERHEQLTPDAYAAYLRGRYFWHQRAVNSPSNLQLATEYFRSVTAAAPNYAPGYAALSQALLYTSRYVRSPKDHPAIQQARAAVAKALALDPTSAMAYTTLASLREGIDWDWEGAEADFRRALSYDPNNAEIHLLLARLLAYGGRYDEAQRDVELALELDPLSATILDSAFYIHMSGGRWDKARDMTARLARLAPNDSTPIYCASALAALRGNCAAALDGLRSIENRGSEMTQAEVSYLKGYVLGRCGGREAAVQFFNAYEREPESLAIALAELWSSIGDRANVLRWVEESFRRREQFSGYIPTDPWLAPFRDDPRFQAVLKQLNYPAHWRKQ
jgi:serine/threonine protein kinase/TolB-like protein/Tfp pilus assembly protein PilF